MKHLFSMIILAGLLMACSKQPAVIAVTNTPSTPPSLTYADSLTYLALGDSYTIGQSVPLTQSFPYQLAAQLKQARHFVSNPTLIATTGWTTDELIAAINTSSTKDKTYDIVTLLIGVNNQYRSYSKDVYRAEFKQLLTTATAYAAGKKERVFVLSIPDWGVTPYATGFDRSKVAMEIDAFNAINKQETQAQGVAYVDITAISKKAGTDASLTAADGLHPSAVMYELWVNALLPAVLKGVK